MKASQVIQNDQGSFFLLNNKKRNGRSSSSSSSVENSDNDWMVSRVLTLMNELPTLAQGSKIIDIRMHIKLLIGYLRVIGTDKSTLLGTATKELRNPLISTSHKEMRRTELICLFCPRFSHHPN